MIKTLIPKVLFYSLLISISVICFFVFMIFNFTKDILLSAESEEERNIPPTNIFGQDLERYRRLNILDD